MKDNLSLEFKAGSKSADKSGHFRVKPTVVAITTLMSVGIVAFSGAMNPAYAGSGWAGSTNISGDAINVPTYYANSPSGIRDFTSDPTKSNCFNANGVKVTTCDTGTALNKFVDALPSLGTSTQGQGDNPPKIPVAAADTSTYPGSDYYEIGVVEYTQQMHSNLAKPTKLRGYVQIVHSGGTALGSMSTTYGVNTSGPSVTVAAPPTYLGPVISATSGTPVRIKFVNLLPTGTGGNLRIPVDTTLSGAGVGPDGVTKYQQNRAELHLHGGDNPWISDGTPHQWILPAADETALKASHPAMARGVGAKNVPDMPDPGPGAVTYYYPNAASGRLMFYHDHAFGLTRLNVYAGEAAGYLLSDAAGVGENESHLAAALAGVPQIPLVIQDKTFVPKDITAVVPTAAGQDAKWNMKNGTTPDQIWGVEGDLWFPHVYETNQDPTSADNTNPPGRWDWGPWFWPVFPTVYNLPTGYTDDATTTPEAYMDTPLVNGKAYPTLTVDPKAYRFRVLNASNDRFVNLGLYLAADKITTDPDHPTNPNKAPTLCDGSTRTRLPPATVPIATECTEVKMVSFDESYVPPTTGAYHSGKTYTPDGTSAFPTTGGLNGTGWGTAISELFPSGVPDPATAGPHIYQIGTEAGLLAGVVDIPSTIINFEYNKRSVTVLNVFERGLWLGAAERADVVVDFSQYAGKTLILYNDSPAPVPAGDPRIDYYTGDGDNTSVGGAPNTLPGQGPNTRTIMQIVVNPVTPTPFSLLALQAALPLAYASAQPMPNIPEPGYKTAFPGIVAPRNNMASIWTGAVKGGLYQSMTFVTPVDIWYKAAAPSTTVAPTTLTHAAAGDTVSVYLPNKTIQELFDPLYGRMNATLGVELPFTTSLTATTIPLGYIDPATESIEQNETVFWKITHNGVDTHPVHFHLVNVQVINRVGWDGTVKPPLADEIGWKETIKMHPLEDVVVAARAKTPTLKGVTTSVNGSSTNGFGLPVSNRLMDPTQQAGSMLGFTQINPVDGTPLTVVNAMANYGWEYVWHCHILGHEENDFMRAVVYNANETPPAAPTNLVFVPGANKLTWTDAATTEYGYKVERTVLTDGQPGPFTDLTATVPYTSQAQGVAPLANATSFIDTTRGGQTYRYRVTALGGYGNNSTSLDVDLPPQTPSGLTGVASNATTVTLRWNAVSNASTGYNVTRNSTVIGSATGTSGSISYVDSTAASATTYTYGVIAINGTGSSNPATVSVTLPAAGTVPTAPSGLTGTIAVLNTLNDTVVLNWNDNSNNETGFQIQRSTNPSFTNPTNFTVASNVKTFTQTVSRTGKLTYYYRVLALNTFGNSAWSNTKNLTAP